MSNLSIIIPVYNEEKSIRHTLQHLFAMADESFELIVVDGGSTDNTIPIAEKEGATIIHSEKGRSKQMNAGAKMAQHPILYFLHADSLPPKHFDTQIRSALKMPNVVFGCFRMRFDWNHWFLRFSGWLTKFNSKWCRGGDQSLFVLKSVFDQAGGFDNNLIIYEDNEILPRLKRHGKFYIISDYIITSARNYRRNGVLRLQAIFTIIHIRYQLGAKHEDLLNYYKRKKR